MIIAIVVYDGTDLMYVLLLLLNDEEFAYFASWVKFYSIVMDLIVIVDE